MLTSQEIIIRLALASLLGALIGLERERKDWAAGLRTHMMVCVGACLIMIVSAFGFSDIIHEEHVSLDPSRIAAQVVSGIGFIGAGTIIFLKQGTIRGLTTASGLWTVAAIGLATGSGLYFAAAATTGIALIILWALKPLEERFFKKYRHMTLRIVTQPNVDHTEFLKGILSNEKLKITSFTLNKSEAGSIFLVTFENININKMDIVINELKNDPIIQEVFWAN